MANVLTDLAPDIYVAADIVGREQTGIIASATVNGDGSQNAAVGQTVRSFFTRSATVVDIAPSMTVPEGTDQTIDNKTLTITKQRGVEIPWTGEDMKYVNAGNGFTTIYGDQIAQAMRALANEIEVDLGTEAYKNASRAVGTAGTTPFSADFKLVAQARQILVDNGVPVTDGRVSMVLNTLAGTNLRNLAQLQKVNESGNDRLLRNGVLLDLQGIMLRESAGIQTHTKGTGTGYALNGAASVGSTAIAVDTGSGTVLAGDVVTFQSDTVNKYVVNSALSGGSLTIGTPGLRIAEADGQTMAVGDSYTANLVFHQSALELAIRAPASPFGGDAAVDVMTVQDPYSGLVFEVSAYKGFKKAMFLVSAVWGFKAWKPDAIALLLG